MIEKLQWREEKLLPRRIVFEPINSQTFIKKEQDLSFLHWKTRSFQPQGLKNIGNTCFLNSTLQCLLHTPAVHNFPHTCGKFFCVVCALKKLLNRRSSVPQEFLSTVPKMSRQFQIGRQADAHELLLFLVDKIESKDFKQVVFSGELQSTVKCKECRYESMVNEIFLDLSLEVSSNTIEKCINDFCREEILTGENRYNCPNCKKKTNASKQYLIKSSPNILTIQLKRFTNSGKKDNRTVGYSEKLVLSKELLSEEKVTYSLYAVLIHIGFGCRSGHYYSFVKSANDLWYEVNDNSVSQTSASRVLSHNGAYILMYRRDVPRTRPFENSVLDNKNSVEKITHKVEKRNERVQEIGRKYQAHPTSPILPSKKVKPEMQNFQTYWKKEQLALGYVKDEYDSQLDKGKLKKKKKHRNSVSANVWDRVRIKT